jgi:hypothetical protein
MKRDWEELTATSYEDTVVEIKHALENREYDDANEGLAALLESMSQDSKHALKSQLGRLMMHVLKWTMQPEKRSGSWAVSIDDAREQIGYLMESKPSLTRRYVESIWNDVFRKATRRAELETQVRSTVESLDWQVVFEAEYSLPTRG